MAHTSRNFVVAYIVLVGLPLLGLAGVLRTGRTLTPPISVDGVWKVDADPSQPDLPSCSKAISSLANSSFVISQSGKSLVVSFNSSKTGASGTIEGKSLTASLVLARDTSGDSGCGDQRMALTATIDPKSEPRSLAGVLAVKNCTSCVPLEFHAVRQPRVPVGAAH